MVIRDRCTAPVVIICLTITVYTLAPLLRKPCPPCENNRLDSKVIPETKVIDKPHFVIGILSATHKQYLRDAQRETWISKIRAADVPFKVTVKFLLDGPTTDTEKENQLYSDIIYLNITTHGRAVKFSEKLYVWYKHVHQHYPDALLTAKMDDDVYLCVPEIFNRIEILQSKTLYYGFTWAPKQQLIDELFVVLGKTLIDRIVERKYCYNPNDCNPKKDLVVEAFGTIAIKKWIDKYDDLDFLADNSKFTVIGRNQTGQFIQKANTILNSKFCEKWLLYHKSSTHMMRKVHELTNSKQ